MNNIEIQDIYQKQIFTNLEDLAVVEALDGSLSVAQVISIKRDVVALQVFRGTQGISTDSTVRFK